MTVLENLVAIAHGKSDVEAVERARGFSISSRSRACATSGAPS